MGDQKKILVIKLRALGDSVLLSSTLSSIKEAYPQSEIHLVLPPAWAPLYANDPRVHTVYPFAAKANLWESIKLATKLRAQSMDIALALHANFRSALLSFLSGAHLRAHHFHGHADANLLSTVEIPGKGELKPILERDLDALRALGFPQLKTQKTQLWVTPTESAKAQAYLRANNLRGPVLALGIGASRPTKIWPLEYFSEIAQRWEVQTQGSVVAFFGPKEKALAAKLPPFVHPLENLPLREAMALLSECRVLVGNDSGPKHMAAALGVKTLSFFGPEDPFEWHPYDEGSHPKLFIPHLACRTELSPNGNKWCGLHICVVEKHKCMTQLGPSEAWKLLEKFLG